MKRLISILVLLLLAGAAAATLAAPTTNHIGAKISGYYWDLMGQVGIQNGTINGNMTFNGTHTGSGDGLSGLNLSNVTGLSGRLDAMNVSSAANRTYAQGVSDGINISVAALQVNNTYFNGSVFPNSTNFKNDTIGTNASTQLRAVSNLTATYTLNTEYTSASGRPTMVIVTANFSASTGDATLRAYAGTSPISGAVGVRFPTNTTNLSTQLVFIAAANSAYAVNTTTTGDGVVTLEDWREVLVN